MSVDDERPTGRASTRSTIERVALGVVLACLLEGCAPKRIALPGDPGAHGPYRDREREADLQMRLRPHTKAIAAAMGLIGLAAYGLSARRS